MFSRAVWWRATEEVGLFALKNIASLFITMQVLQYFWDLASLDEVSPLRIVPHAAAAALLEPSRPVNACCATSHADRNHAAMPTFGPQEARVRSATLLVQEMVNSQKAQEAEEGGDMSDGEGAQR